MEIAKVTSTNITKQAYIENAIDQNTKNQNSPKLTNWYVNVGLLIVLILNSFFSHINRLYAFVVSKISQTLFDKK